MVERADLAAAAANTRTSSAQVGTGQPACPRLSVIIPAYHEVAGIAGALHQVADTLESTKLTYEVIMVADGDRATYDAAAAARVPGVRVLGYGTNRGKGFALRFGVAHARGDLVTFIDSDMEISPVEIGRMAALLELYEADMVVGSKRHPMSEVSYPALRRFQSFIYHLVVRSLFHVRVSDTQTGLKMMRREVSERVVALTQVSRFAFDLELIAIARRLGYTRIIEAPVKIDYKFATTTNMAAVFRVLVDTAAIYYRLNMRRIYDGDRAGATPRVTVAPTDLLGEGD